MKRKQMKIAVFVILLPLLLCVGCGNKNSSNVPADDSSNISSVDDYSFLELYNEIKSSAEEAFADKKYFDMGYDQESNTITLQFAIEGLSNELLLSQAAGTPNNWEAIKGTYTELSATVKNKFEEYGYDVDVIVIILNDTNYDKVFLGALNGVGVYDYFDPDEQ